MQIPIRFNSADIGVVIVVLLVCGSLKACWNGSSEQDGEDAVADVIAAKQISDDDLPPHRCDLTYGSHQM